MTSFVQQLAALLIARQVISNLKESAIPYLIEQLRLARLSFELFGALSPSEARPAPGEEAPPPGGEATETASTEEIGGKSDDKDDKDATTDGSKGIKQPRNVSQAELEASLYRVGHPANSLLSDVTFKVWSRLRRSLFVFLLLLLSLIINYCTRLIILFNISFLFVVFFSLLWSLFSVFSHMHAIAKRSVDRFSNLANHMKML